MNDSIHDQVAEATEDFMAAIVAKDEAAVRGFHASGFRGTTASGRRVDVEEHLRRVMGSSVNTTLLELDSREVDGVVVAWGRQRMTAEAPEGTFSPAQLERLRHGVDSAFTQVWRHEGGGWRCVASHVTEINEQQSITREEVEALYERWGSTVLEHDREGLRQVLADDYVFTTPDGARLDRDEVVELEMTVPPPLGITVDSFRMLSDDVIQVRGHDEVRGDFSDDSISPELAARIAQGVTIAFTSVWRRDAGGWRVVSNDAHVLAQQLQER